jgi:hypothetical protein
VAGLKGAKVVMINEIAKEEAKGRNGKSFRVSWPLVDFRHWSEETPGRVGRSRIREEVGWLCGRKLWPSGRLKNIQCTIEEL